jgi:hypothetical protein
MILLTLFSVKRTYSVIVTVIFFVLLVVMLHHLVFVT